VEYLDLSEAKVQAGFPDLYAQAEAQKLPYPLVMINDQLRLVGSARYYEVLPLVEQALAH
jgi:disulfide oxidoreductase YuzD